MVASDSWLRVHSVESQNTDFLGKVLAEPEFFVRIFKRLTLSQRQGDRCYVDSIIQRHTIAK